MPDPAAAKAKLKLLWLSCGKKDGLIRISQGVHAYLKENDVPHIWHVDGNAHDPTHWKNSLYLFVTADLSLIDWNPWWVWDHPLGIGAALAGPALHRYLSIRCWKPQFLRLFGDLITEMAFSDQVCRESRGGDELSASFKKARVDG